jgi:hypothetical protein
MAGGRGSASARPKRREKKKKRKRRRQKLQMKNPGYIPCPSCHQKEKSRQSLALFAKVMGGNKNRVDREELVRCDFSLSARRTLLFINPCTPLAPGKPLEPRDIARGIYMLLGRSMHCFFFSREKRVSEANPYQEAAVAAAAAKPLGSRRNVKQLTQSSSATIPYPHASPARPSCPRRS